MNKEMIYLGSNFKMNFNNSEVTEYLQKFLSYLPELDLEKICLFLIPSFASLSSARALIAGHPVLLGAQNVHDEEKGEYTGEISALMLKDIPVDIVELGHSERRRKMGESDFLIGQKARRALDYAMKPLICIGENTEEKDLGLSKVVLEKQIRSALFKVSSEESENLIFAYEPVWAIGENGKPATADYVEEMHHFISEVLSELFPESHIPILFGGSVNHDNYLEYIRLNHVDGLFIGRSAWKADSFIKIIKGILNEYI